MKKVIKNSVYDTETATELADCDNGYPVNDLYFYRERLYKTKSGKYFLHGEGGGNSRYGEWHGNSGGPGEKIMPMTYDEETEWAQNSLEGDEYIKIFGEPEECRQTLSGFVLSETAKAKLDRMRSETGESMSSIVDRLIIGAGDAR